MERTPHRPLVWGASEGWGSGKGWGARGKMEPLRPRGGSKGRTSGGEGRNLG